MPPDRADTPAASTPADRADTPAASTPIPTGGAASTTTGALAAVQPAPFELPAAEAALLTDWYQRVGPRRVGEAFGELVARAAFSEIGKPYYNPPTPAGPETLSVRLEDFQCVSLVESSLALARCIAMRKPDAACFVRELEGVRYRGGKLDGFVSKLHYFDEWISDNAQRGRLHELSEGLGGKGMARPSDFVTRHAELYPPLGELDVLSSMRAVEARLRASAAWGIGRDRVKQAERGLESGDVIAILGPKAGLLVSHAALVYRDKAGKPHLLHASSSQHRVVVSPGDIADYVLRRPERLGIMAARPLAPEVKESAPTAAR
jgi:hypothetical protein